MAGGRAPQKAKPKRAKADDDPSGQKCNVVVAVRIRPASVGVDGVKDSARDDPKKQVCVKVKASSVTLLDRKRNKSAPQTFTYDQAYDQTATQEQIFQDLGTILLKQTLHGYNGCLFAYGQTGSGKTYSMFGPPGWASPAADTSDRGLVPRFTSSLFTSLEFAAAAQPTPPPSPASTKDGSPFGSRNGEYSPLAPQKPYKVEVSVYEIYNEKVFDLLVTDLLPDKSGRLSESSRGAWSLGPNSVRLESAAQMEPSGSGHPVAQPGSTKGATSREKLESIFAAASRDPSKSSSLPARGELAEGLSYKVREHPEKGPYVDGLSKWTVTSQDEILGLIKRSVRHRHTASTQCNDRSSRSHLIVEIGVTTCKFEKTEQDVTELSSKVNLVDLAGSERSNVAGTQGERLKEGANINKSLLALGNVIESLASKAAFVKYRDSSLTWLLREALGGNSRTVMLATVSPHTTYYDESAATLLYADRAKKITNIATVNKSSRRRLINELRREISQLKKELCIAQTPRGGAPSGDPAAQPVAPPSTGPILLKESSASFMSPMHELAWRSQSSLVTPPDDPIVKLYSVEWYCALPLGAPAVAQIALLEGTTAEVQRLVGNVCRERLFNESASSFEAAGTSPTDDSAVEPWSPKGGAESDAIETMPSLVAMLASRLAGQAGMSGGDDQPLLQAAIMLHTNTVMDMSKLSDPAAKDAVPETAMWLEAPDNRSELGLVVRADEREAGGGGGISQRLAVFVRRGGLWVRCAASDAQHGQAVRTVSDRVARTLDIHRIYAAVLRTQPPEVSAALARGLPSLSPINAMSPPIGPPSGPLHNGVQVARIETTDGDGQPTDLTPLRWDAALEKWKAHGASRASVAAAVDALLRLVDTTRTGLGLLGDGASAGVGADARSRRHSGSRGSVDGVALEGSGVGGRAGGEHVRLSGQAAGSASVSAPCSVQHTSSNGGLTSTEVESGMTGNGVEDEHDTLTDSISGDALDLRRRCKLLQNEADVARKRLASIEADHAQFVTRLEAQHEAAELDTHTKVGQLEGNLNRLSGQYAQTLRQLREQHDLRKEHGQQATCIKNLEDELESASRASARCDANIARLEDDNQKLRDLVRSLRVAPAELLEDPDLERLRSEVEAEKRKRKAAEDRLKDTGNFKSNMSYHLRQERERNADMKKRMDEAVVESDSARASEKQARDELKKAHDQLHYLRIEREGGERRETSILDLSIQVQMLGEDKQRLEALLDAARRELRDTIATSHAKMKEELAHYKSTSAEYEAKHKSAEARALDYRLRAEREKEARFKKDDELKQAREDLLLAQAPRSKGFAPPARESGASASPPAYMRQTTALQRSPVPKAVKAARPVARVLKVPASRVTKKVDESTERSVSANYGHPSSTLKTPSPKARVPVKSRVKSRRASEGIVA